MHRDFDAAAREAVGEPLTFTLGGEVFTCAPTLAALPMLKLAKSADKGGAEGVAAFYDFLTAMLVQDDVPRFEAMMQRERIGMEQLSELVAWVVEEATGRPTQRPSDLPERPSNTSRPLTAVSSPQDLPEAHSV